MSAQTLWIRNIHVAKNKLGLDEDAYRALLEGCAGVCSSTEIKNWEQYEAVMAGMKKLGFAFERKKRPARKQENPVFITPRQEYYIRGLWELASRNQDEKSLRAMCKRITGVDDLRFCYKSSATKLIIALRKITASAGFNPDGPERGCDVLHGV